MFNEASRGTSDFINGLYKGHMEFKFHRSPSAISPDAKWIAVRHSRDFLR